MTATTIAAGPVEGIAARLQREHRERRRRFFGQPQKVVAPVLQAERSPTLQPDTTPPVQILSRAIVAADQSQVVNGVPKIELIVRLCAHDFGISPRELLSHRRTQNVVRPRHVAMYLAKMMTSRSLPEIGRRMGGRDHTTVLHAVGKIDRLVATDAEIAERVGRIRTSIQAVGDEIAEAGRLANAFTAMRNENQN